MGRWHDACACAISGQVSAMAPHVLHTALDVLCPWVQRAPVGIACSGGPDSLALLHAAVHCFGQANVVALHIDHQLQAGSAAVGAALRQWCESQNVRCLLRQVVVPAGASLEAQARTVRYHSLFSLQAEAKLSAIVTAHHLNDQAETVLMRLLRGTGPSGLAAMATQRHDLLRPWLTQPQAVILTYANAHNLPFWLDPMNADPRFLRTRVRQQLLPLLRAENPQIDASLASLAVQMGDWRKTLDEALAYAYQRAAATPDTRSAISVLAPAIPPPPWPLPTLLQLSDVLRARLLEQSLAAWATHPTRQSYAAWEQALAYQGTEPKQWPLAVAPGVPGARLLRVERSMGLVHITATPPMAPPLAVMYRYPHFLRLAQPGDRMVLPSRSGPAPQRLAQALAQTRRPIWQRRDARVIVAGTPDEPGDILWCEGLGPAVGVDIEVTLAK